MKNIKTFEQKNTHNELIDILVEYLKTITYNVYVCGSCGYSRGHQIVWCPKCPGKMPYRKNISAYDLGFLFSDSIKWNIWQSIMDLSKLSNTEISMTDYCKLVAEIYDLTLDKHGLIPGV